MIGENCSILYDLRNIWKSITLPKVFLNSFFSSLHHETYVTKKKKVFGSHLSLICLYDFVFKVNTIYHVLQLCGLWILSITVRKTDHVRNIKKQSRIPLSHSTLDPQSNHSWQSRPFLIRVKQIWHLHSVDVRVPLAPPHCCSANGVKFTFCLCFLPVYVCSKLYT